jgi:Uma2 family endonuclease
MSQVMNKLVTIAELSEILADNESITKECELVRGEILFITPAGADHGGRSMDLALELGSYVKRHQLGRLFSSDTGFILSTNPDTVRAPDISFVKQERLNRLGPLPSGFFPFAPDLAIEVVSPNDRLDEVEDKILDYLTAGTTLVVVVMPRQKQVMLRRKDQQPLLIREGDLTFEDLVPGFAYSLAELLK